MSPSRPTSEKTRSEQRAGSPPPEAPEKPDSPGDIRKPSWMYVFRKTLREFSADQCTDLAAALVYYSVLALFPGLIAVLSLVGLVGQGPSTVHTITGVLNQVGVSSPTINQAITQVASSQGAGFALVLGLLSALWSASGYVGAFGRAMNRMYEVDEGRPVWKLRPVMLLVTLVTVLLAAAVLVALVVTGPAATAVGNAIGLGSTAVLVWQIAKWPIMLAVVVLIVALLYYATPNVKQPKFRWISVGAVFAIVTWVVVSFLFGLYVANFSSYNKTYGSLAGVIVFLLWLWLTNLALLFGAELDSELERGRELQAGIAAEETLQLPPRDTKVSDKKAAKEEEDAERGRRLRETHGRTMDPDEAGDGKH
jgi:membrane protein